ncbi:hypothetical protein WDW89_02520 [Deltaproteobacteria bacterium TL4]
MKHKTFPKIVPVFLMVFMIGGILFSLSADPGQLGTGQLKFKIGEKDYLFLNAQGTVETKAGQKVITVGLKDAQQKTKLYITAFLADEALENHLSTQYHEISLMFKDPDASIFVMPAVRLARQTSFLYAQKVGTGRNIRYVRTAPDWANMSRKERLDTGKGVIRRKQMEDTAFFLNLYPTLKNGQLVELKGVFSGVVKQKNSTTQAMQNTTINDGEFRVIVQQY